MKLPEAEESAHPGALAVALGATAVASAVLTLLALRYRCVRRRAAATPRFMLRVGGQLRARRGHMRLSREDDVELEERI